MTGKDIEQAGREMLTLETLAKISALEQEIAGYQHRHGSYDELLALTCQENVEDFELDDTLNAWRWAVEYLASLREHLNDLHSDAA